MDPMKALSLRYHKRKQISVDGYTPGLEYPYATRRPTESPNTGYAQQYQRLDDYLGGQDGVAYDPGKAFYSSNRPHHRNGEPSWNSTFSETPPWRMPLPSAPEPHGIHPPCPLDDLLAQIEERRQADLLENPNHLEPHPILFGVRGRDIGACSDFPLPQDPVVIDAPDVGRSAIDIKALFDPAHRSKPPPQDILANALAEAEYEHSVAMGALLDQFHGAYLTGGGDDHLVAMIDELEELDNSEVADMGQMVDQDDPLDASRSLPDAFNGSSLEQIVEDEWRQMKQDAMMDPYAPFPPPGMMEPFGPIGGM